MQSLWIGHIAELSQRSALAPRIWVVQMRRIQMAVGSKASTVVSLMSCCSTVPEALLPAAGMDLRGFSLKIRCLTLASYSLEQ